MADSDDIVERIEIPVKAGDAPVRRRVLFVTDNGHGLGHLTRMLAIARRLSPFTAPKFVTLSMAYAVLQRAGVDVEHIPTRKQLGLPWSEWNKIALDHLLQVLSANTFEDLVLDHVRPWALFKDVRRQHPSMTMTWVRRGLWTPNRNMKALERSKFFDQIIEPLDLASLKDRGGTTTTAGARRVSPITLFDRSELRSRAEARKALALPSEGTCVLLQLSADSDDQLHDVLRSAAELVHLLDPNAVIVIPTHPLRPHVADHIEDAVSVSLYPMAQYFKAFDYAVSAAGYNAFHELVLAAVPTLFVARDTNSVDNQALRASIAPHVGLGLHAATVRGKSASQALAILASPNSRHRMIAAAQALIPMNGAREAAAMIDSDRERRAKQRELQD